jgi:hypothetical protein
MICSKCKQDKNESCFSFRNKSLEIRHKQCLECQKRYRQKHYKTHKDDYRKKNRRNKLKNRQLVYDYLMSHPCVDCGESDPVVLDFDHIKDKSINVSKLIGTYSWKTILQEINKCEVRCANCHRRKTAKQFRWYKDIAS